MKKIKIVCLFARRLGIETLQGIVNDNIFDVVLVVTYYYEPVKYKIERLLFKEYVDLCDNAGIPLIVVHKNQEPLEILKNLDFDFLVANCYREMILGDILKLAKVASLNMHRSLLPKYKGAKPLKQAIENRETETGTSVHILSSKLDSGKVIDQYKIYIKPKDKEFDLFRKLYPIQYPLLKRVLLKMFDDVKLLSIDEIKELYGG